MNIEGAEWAMENNELRLNDEISNNLPTLLFKWRKVEKIKQQNLGLLLIFLYKFNKFLDRV